MNMPTISIIIPVYNGERYIIKCLNSILSQTFQDWECIVVNDGSSDSTKKVIDDFLNTVSKADKFKIIHKNNEGVSVARNTGLESAIGEWIAFSDADDYYYPEAFKQLLYSAETTDAKIVLGNADRLYMDGKKVQRYPAFKVIEKKQEFPKGSIEMWGDLFHRSLFENPNHRFTPGLAYLEDRCLMLKLLSVAGGYATSPEPLYCQYRNPYSVMRSPNGLRMARHCFWAGRLMKDYETETPLFKKEIHEDFRNAIRRGCSYFISNKNSSYEKLEKTYLEFFENRYNLRIVYAKVICANYKRYIKNMIKKIFKLYL